MQFKKIGILIIILFQSNLLFAMETLPLELKSAVVTELMTSNYHSLGHELGSIAALKLISKEFNVLIESFEQKNKYKLADWRLSKYKKPLFFIAAITYDMPQLINLLDVVVDDGICIANSKHGDFDQLFQDIKQKKVIKHLAGTTYVIVKEAMQGGLSWILVEKVTKKLIAANVLWFEKENEIKLQSNYLIKTESPFHLKLTRDNHKRMEMAQKARDSFLNYCEYCDRDNVKTSSDEERRQIIVRYIKAFIKD